MELPKFLPEREETIKLISERVLDCVKEYEISAHDFLQIMDCAKNEGLKKFTLR